MTTILHLDFETRSTLDLKEVGLYNYARHPTTDVWCMAWAFDDEEPVIWTPDGGDMEARVWNWLYNARAHDGHNICAHNAHFEEEIYAEIMQKRYGWPAIDSETLWQCTMEMAYAMALPGKLENCAAALGIEQRKDLQGGRLMLQMAQPRTDNPLTWWDDPDRLIRLYEYCRQDVKVEREIYKRLLPLSKEERQVSLMSHRINQRGIYVDQPSVKAAIEIVESTQRILASKLFTVTSGSVGYPSEVAILTKWVRSRGVDVDGIAKQDVVDLLANDRLPDDVRRALEIRQEFAKTSAAKLYPMLGTASADGRLRGMFQYHGASTGRWAGRKVQLHNLPRPTMSAVQIEQAIGCLKNPDLQHVACVFDLVYGPPMTVISNSLRSMLMAAPGHDLMAGDFSNIEGRIIAWLAGEEWKLNAFHAADMGTGPDIYLLSASQMYHLPPDQCKPYRQIGKVRELSMGFGGGVGAFQRMAPTLGVKIPDAEAEENKIGWRKDHPHIVAYWQALENAAIASVLSPGSTHSAGKNNRQVKFRTNGSFLWCQLPSGRVLCYPYPRIEEVMAPWGELRDALTYMAEDSMTHQWVRVSTYGGKLAENVTQAVARDCLVASMLLLDAAGAQIVMHVHDEIVIELPESNALKPKQLSNMMAAMPVWAAGLPVKVESWRGKRYRK
jgi:DNA polymerase